MKRKILCIGLIAAVIALFACAFTVDKNSSIKDLSHPYMNTYECTRATLGDNDLLEEYDHFRIILGDNDELTLLIKKKGENEKRFSGKYSFDTASHELTADIGILGYVYRQKTILEGGKFTITLPILTKELIMIFEAR